MKISASAQKIFDQLNDENVKLGDLRKIAKEIKKDHSLAIELWSTGHFLSRLLATLIMDKKLMNIEFIDRLDIEMQTHPEEEKLQLADWLMANQLTKDKQSITLIESWRKNESPLKRRIFWYYQARLRWMGKTDFDNTEDLLSYIESDLLDEQPEVQWAMNYTAGQIGKWQENYRTRCIKIGENSGLYKDEIVAKGCTPSYLPEFIAIEVSKLK